MDSFLSLRIDLDSTTCVKGVPYFLDLASSKKCKADFFAVMGPETGAKNALEAAIKTFTHTEKHAPQKINGQQNAETQKPSKGGFQRMVETVKEHGLMETARFTLFPHNSIAQANQEILKEAIAKGFCVGTHGWNHFTWCKNEKQTPLDFSLMIAKYLELFKKKPLTHTSPMGRFNPTMLKLLDEAGYQCSADFAQCKTPFPFKAKIGKKTFKHIQLPFSHTLFWEVDGKKISLSKKKLQTLVQKNAAIIIPTHGKAWKNKQEMRLIEETIDCALGLGAKPATFLEIAKAWKAKAKEYDATEYQHARQIF